MAYEIPGFTFSLIAGADLTTHQYKFVFVNSSGQAVLPSANTRAVGVLQNKPNTGQVGTIMNTGISKVVAGGTVAAGDDVTSDASGRATVAAATHRVNGIALQAASGAGIIIPVLLQTDGASA